MPEMQAEASTANHFLPSGYQSTAGFWQKADDRTFFPTLDLDLAGESWPYLFRNPFLEVDVVLATTPPFQP
jgi:hypothetical protein